MLEKRIRDLLVDARANARKQGLEAEFNFHRERSSLIRLGNSSVALSTSEELSRLDVVVQQGRRSGSYSLTSDITSPDQLAETLRIAAVNCHAALEKDYDPIFGVVEESVDDSTGFDPALESLSPVTKTELCKKVVDAVKPMGKYDFSGSWSSGSTEMYFISTANDNEAYRRLTDGALSMVLKEQEKKWELEVGRTQKKAGEFSADDFIAEFKDMLPVYEKNPGYKTHIDRQRVMFGPDAISSLLGLTIWGAFIGRMWEEKRAFSSNLKPGDRLFPESITITDDPTNPNVFGMPFDLKGHRRLPRVMCDKGILKAILYDSATAAKYKRQPTGSDLGNDDFCLSGGTAPAGVEAGRKLAGNALYIPQLHYTHMPDPTKGMFTGSSRFNARLIKDGEFAAPLLSSRVTDTIPSVFGGITAISSRTIPWNVSSTYDRRQPAALSIPEYIICNNVRISDVADSF
ncbi:MAG: metallopeptidase TldD-related protein [candidate division WOR-3 bacterium]|nr:metallopeptidase TldD-related protein [candidate division WOR-3 bacterium]